MLLASGDSTTETEDKASMQPFLLSKARSPAIDTAAVIVAQGIARDRENSELI